MSEVFRRLVVRRRALFAVMGAVGLVAPLVAGSTAIAGAQVPAPVSPARPGLVSTPPPNPPANIQPSPGFFDYCGSPVPRDPDACAQAALASFDAARKAEGAGPMALPNDFASLSLAEQLLAVTDLERVGYREPPVVGLSPLLDTYAETGAEKLTDPGFPDSGAGGRSNWYGGPPNPLLTEFTWIYDDGYGSGNMDCKTPAAPGCWGHRLGILGDFASPVYMGAAVVPQKDSATTVVMGSPFWDPQFPIPTPAETTHHPLQPTWAQISKTVPLVLPQKVGISTVPGRLSRRLIVAWSPATWQEAHFRVVGGGGAWSSGPRCPLEAGGRCGIVVSFRPRHPGTTMATLVAVSDAGVQTVELDGWGRFVVAR